MIEKKQYLVSTFVDHPSFDMQRRESVVELPPGAKLLTREQVEAAMCNNALPGYETDLTGTLDDLFGEETIP